MVIFNGLFTGYHFPGFYNLAEIREVHPSSQTFGSTRPSATPPCSTKSLVADLAAPRETQIKIGCTPMCNTNK